MNGRQPSLLIRVDPTNPGQFLGCCGLLELADRLWNGAEGCFASDGRVFALYAREGGASRTPFLDALMRTELANSMTELEHSRRDRLQAMGKKALDRDESLRAEKDSLDSLWRKSPIRLGTPFNVRVDWFLDSRAGGVDFKTWAGQQSVLDLASGMRRLISNLDLTANPTERWFLQATSEPGIPFYFDSDVGGMGAAVDVGFSTDSLEMRFSKRPMIELAAFVGLQRFRPLAVLGTRRDFRYWAWTDPLLPEVAAAVVCGALKRSDSRCFEFRLFYRNKYLKSFLPARFVGGA